MPGRAGRPWLLAGDRSAFLIRADDGLCLSMGRLPPMAESLVRYVVRPCVRNCQRIVVLLQSGGFLHVIANIKERLSVMIAWFREIAPIRRKLSVAFSLESGLILVCLLAVLVANLSPAFLPFSVLVCIAAFVVSALAGYSMRRLIADPYVLTVERMEALAAGDLDTPVGFTHHKDCVGRLNQAMSTFRETALARRRAETEAGTLAELHERNQRAEAERNRAAAELELVVNTLAASLEKLAGGVLTQRLTGEFAPQYERLRTDFNTAVERLHDAMTAIISNVTGIRSGASEISVAADDLARRTEQQAASLEQTAAALDQITATVRKTAEGAGHAREVVTTAQADAQRSGAVVAQAWRR